MSLRTSSLLGDFINSFLPYSPSDSVELKLRHQLKIDQDDILWDKLEELDIFNSEKKIGIKNATPAQILQKILLNKWTLSNEDKDMIVMYHKFGYEKGGKKYQIDATMVCKGENQTYTAMAKTVGLPVAIATKLILEGKMSDVGVDVCATWSKIKNDVPLFQLMCQEDRVLVICDEHHHAAQEAAWGDGANAGLSKAKLSLILTGTPIRSDGKDTVWVKLDDQGRIKYKSEGSYTLTYGEAVDLDYYRPVTFHRHNAEFDVQLDENTSVKISGHKENIENKIKKNQNILISAHGNSIRSLCKFLFKLDEKQITKLEIPTGNPMMIELDQNREISNCLYLDKERAQNLIVF